MPESVFQSDPVTLALQEYPARKVLQNGCWLCILLGVVYPEPEIISQMLQVNDMGN